MVVHIEGVCVRNAVIISGLNHTEKDEEVLKYLSGYGSIEHIIRTDDPKREFHRQLIIEIRHDSAMQSLDPSLPSTL